MNKRHKIILALSLAVSGLALLNGAKLSEGLGIILVGASLAWLLGSQLVLRGAMIVWKHRISLATITTVGIVGVYGWIRHDASQTEKRAAAYEAKMKPVRDCQSRNAQFSNADAECEKDPSVNLQAIAQPTPQPIPQPSYRYSPQSQRPPSHNVKALNDTELTTTEFGSLIGGHVRAGETAELLVDDIGGVKIRTADGQIGWASGTNFEVVRK